MLDPNMSWTAARDETGTVVDDSTFIKSAGTVPTDESADTPTLQADSEITSSKYRPLGLFRMLYQSWNSWGRQWRSSAWFITLVVTVGTTTDTLAYTIVVPVLPYRLQELGYTNISSRTSWLLFAYSIGIFICTLPVAYFIARKPYRRGPLLFAILLLELGLILFMLIRPFAVMVISRLLQGAASTVVFVVGLPLIAENVEEKNMGRQLGYAMAGISIGSTIGPPIGGALYFKLGWHAPFVFAIIFCAVDLFLRFLVIEQKDLPPSMRVREVPALIDAEKATRTDGTAAAGEKAAMVDTQATPGSVTGRTGRSRGPGPLDPKEQLGIVGVLLALIRSKRGLAGFTVTFIYGFLIGVIDPTITLRLQSVWHKDSNFVGLVFLAAAAPSFVTGPIVGALADKYGAEWIMAPSMIFALPFLALLLLDSSLPGFVVCLAVAMTALTCAMGPGGLEVALAAREVPGMSEVYQFASINLAFAIASSVGAIVGGQLYDHSGWTPVIWVMFGVTLVCIPIPFAFSGNTPLYHRIFRRPAPPPLPESEPDAVSEAEMKAEAASKHRRSSTRP